MKLFTIGDSVSQGFMSGAAARTDLCFSTLIANVLANNAVAGPPPDYHFPHWDKGGHPVNLERLLRKLNRLYGSDIFGPIEWPLAGQLQAFVDKCVELVCDDKLDVETAAMAKYWTTDLQCKVVDECLQLHGGYGYMWEYPIARAYVDARVQRIYAGTNEIMKELIARGL